MLGFGAVSSERRRALFTVLVQLALTWSCYQALRGLGWQGWWYNIDDVLNFGVDPPFRHRILFVLLARGCQFLVPRLGAMYAFQLSQLVAIFLALFVIRKWSELFVDTRLAFVGQLFAVVALVPTFHYFTFYDVGVVLFGAACLLAAVQGRMWLCLFFFFVGTFNHEGTLLLALDVAALMWATGSTPARSSVWLVAMLFAYAAARAILLYVLPEDALFLYVGPLENLRILLKDPSELFKLALTVGLWYIIAALGWALAPRWLRVLTLVHVAQLLLVSALFGRMIEARLYDSVVPIYVGLALCVVATWQLQPSMDGAESPE